MTQIDSRIAMGVQQLDAGAAVGRGYQLRDLAAQADSRKLDTQIKQQGLKKQGVIADLHRLNTQDGKLNRPAFTQGLSDAGYGADAAGARKEWGDADKAEADAMFKTGEHKMKALDYSGKVIASLLANPNATANDVAREISGLVTAGLMSQEDGARTVREIPNDPGQRRQYLIQKGAQAQQAKDMMGMFMQRMEAVNLGATTQFVDTNPVTNPGIVGQQLQHTATPETKLSAETARRGQDLTDSRARDFNATKVEENRIKLLQGGGAGAATEAERKAATLLQRLEFSEGQLEAALKDNPDAAKPGLLSNGLEAVGLDAASNTMKSTARQQVSAAQLDILDAALTLGTGAAYTREQLTGYAKSYFPQVGDDENTIKDKTARLKNVINAAKIAAGRARPQQAPAAPTAQQPAGQPMAVKDAADYARVPSGATYTTPDGKVRRKP